MSNIKTIRARLGLTQTQFGKRLGVSQPTVCHYESGRHRMPPPVVQKLISYSARRGVAVTWDDVYSTNPPKKAKGPK